MRLLRDQLGYLARFADEIASGAQRLDGRLRQRARLYSQAARGVYQQARQKVMQIRGYDEESNVLANVEHCQSDGGREGCVEQTAKGWVPVGTLVPIGQRRCYQNCRCKIRYRNSRTGEVSG